MIDMIEASGGTAVKGNWFSAQANMCLRPVVVLVEFRNDLPVGTIDVEGVAGGSALGNAFAVGIINVESGGAAVHVLNPIFGIVGIVVNTVAEKISSSVIGAGRELVFVVNALAEGAGALCCGLIGAVAPG